MKKQKIEELLDSDGNIIGNNSYPETGINRETDANNTTDYNAQIHGQNFKNDFLGRFGFYFYESEGDNGNVEKTLAKIMYEKYKETLTHYHNNPENLKKDYKTHSNCDFDSQPEESREHDYEWASDILKALEPHMKKDINEGIVNESKVVEDKLVVKKDGDISDKKDNKELSKIEKVAGLLNKMNKTDLNKLVNLLELKK